jgi:MSHA biogenesis protein MshM
MYGDYWNLTQLPFENGSDPRFFFRGRSHEPALLKLQYVVEQSKGVALLVGEHGVGKTYVSHVLEQECRRSAADGECPPIPFFRLHFPRLSADEILRYLAGQLSSLILPTSAGGDLIVQQLERALRGHAEAGNRPAVVLDDAHLIESPQVLQVLAQVMSLSESQGLPLSLTLIGQPELVKQVLRVPALNSRVSVRAALHPFDAAETAAYIQHRLSIAGMTREVFDDQALAAFHQHSLGIPRRINQLCDLALLVGYADELPSLSSGEVEAAAEELLTVAVD